MQPSSHDIISVCITSCLQFEETVRGMKFPYTSIFRPGVLDRGEGNRRFLERFAGKLLCTVSGNAS